MDEIGLIDSLTYKGGIWMTATSVGTLLQEIFRGLDTQYECDPDLAAVELRGWIPICTYREAIQQVAFAAGAYVLAARQGGIPEVWEIRAGILSQAWDPLRGAVDWTNPSVPETLAKDRVVCIFIIQCGHPGHLLWRTERRTIQGVQKKMARIAMGQIGACDHHPGIRTRRGAWLGFASPGDRRGGHLS